MPKRTNKFVFFVDEDGQDRPQGEEMDLSAADAERYDSLVGQVGGEIRLDDKGSEGSVPEGSGPTPDANDEPLSLEELQSKATDEGYDSLSAPELTQLADEYALTADIEGSGANGKILKKDLVTALEANEK